MYVKTKIVLQVFKIEVKIIDSNDQEFRNQIRTANLNLIKIIKGRKNNFNYCYSKVYQKRNAKFGLHRKHFS